MNKTQQRHRDAASRHDAAADMHDRSAGFWHTRGDGQRAALQRRLAAHERDGATREREWADLLGAEVVRPR